MSKWIEHVKETKEQNPEVMKEDGLKGILKIASETYKKIKNQLTPKAPESVSEDAHEMTSGVSSETPIASTGGAKKKGSRKAKKSKKSTKKSAKKSKKSKKAKKTRKSKK